MATLQKSKHKKTKVIPTDERDRPTSPLSNNSWVEDFDEPKPTADEKVGVDNEGYKATEVENRPAVSLTSDPPGHGGSFVSVREAEDGGRVDLTDEELDIKDDRPTSAASSLGRAGSPYSDDGMTGPANGDGIKRKKRKRKKERANVVTPVNDDADLTTSLNDSPRRRSPSEAWSMSSMNGLNDIPMDVLSGPSKSSEIAKADSHETTRNRSPGVGTHTASASSRAQSVISVREADESQRIDGQNTAGESGNKTKNTKNRTKEDNRSLTSPSPSTRLNPPQLQHEQQAYVPYVYAHDYLAQVTNDMKKMKSNHLRIVGQIEDTYKIIEDETQNQFNLFVGGLRIQYKDKVKTFRQVIEIHREDFGGHKTYWEETLKSLSARNKALMKEKKKLLIINKMEIDRLEKEKNELTQKLTQRMDVNQSSFAAQQKDLEEERKIFQDRLQTELETEKKLHQEEIERLRQELEDTKSRPLVVPAAVSTTGDGEKTPRPSSARRPSRASVRSSVAGPAGGMAVGTALVVASTTGEMSDAENRREQMEKQLVQSQKDLIVLQTKYEFLQTQYTTLASVASQDSKEAISDQMKVTRQDQEMMTEERQQLKDEIRQWEMDFKRQTGQEPTDEDRSETVHEMETQLAEAETKMGELDSKMDTLASLKEGKVPKTQPSSIPEPVVKTVEIVVPDPSTLALLASSQQQVKELQVRLRDAESKLKGRKTKRSGQTESKAAEENSLKLVLEAVVASSANKESGEDIGAKLETAKADNQDLVAQRDRAKRDLEDWLERYKQEHGSYPRERDEEAKSLYASLDQCNEKCLANEADVTALSILATGQIPSDLRPMTEAQVTPQTTGPASSRQIYDLEDRIQELEEENDLLTEQNSEQEETIKELEGRLAEMESGGGAAAVATAAALATLDLDEDDVEEFGAQIASLRRQVDNTERKHQAEIDAHQSTKEELELIKEELNTIQEENGNLEDEMEGKVAAATVAMAAEMKLKDKSLGETKQRLDELEAEKLQNLPVDVAKEIMLLQGLVKKAENEKEEVQKASIGRTADVDKIKAEFKTVNLSLSKERETNRAHQENLKRKMVEKDKQAKEIVSATEKKYQQREDEYKKQIHALEKKTKEIAAAGGGARVVGGAKGGMDAKSERKIKLLTEQAAVLKKSLQENQDKMRLMEKDLKEAKAGGIGDKQAGKKIEKQLKDLEKKLEIEQKKFEREKKNATELDAELKTTSKELDIAKDEIKKLTNQIDSLGVAAAEALQLKEKVTEQTAELKKLQAEVKALSENFNSERVLRKKYYNMVEDMKGKIRVYCRTRPLSTTEKDRGNFSIIKSPDEYSVEVQSHRGLKEFQFDHIFMPESTQTDVFEDTNNLIQSAVDGYNVCIFAYGQTGSGKTFTMIGDSNGKFPGIAPRAFKKIFELIEENKSKFSFQVESYMLELYNEKLIDLYCKTHGEAVKLEIKKDKKGLVFVQGSVIHEASSAKELYGLFEQGSSSRHVASTKMNSESSRSHLIIGIVIESTNLTTGTVTRGKLSLVDLAGSERAAKTDASAEQLREANSINKSLSALGDVISALSSEQSFIPYRNNKLTMLMQDSLGGNAKTLMFVNISPADYNTEETVVSLTYASRVKLITNDATKNADNKEIARLKEIIKMMKGGEAVEVGEVGEDEEDDEV